MSDCDGKLALYGGRPAIPEGPPAWPLPDEDVREALLAAYADGSWGRYEGPYNQRLTQRLAEMHGLAHAWCCSSGTLAVELALRGLRVSPGEEVILAGYDFPGNFRAIEAVGAVPVLVDIRRQTWCLDAEQLAAAHSPSVRAIIVSHLHGGLAPMPDICDWAARQGVAVVEDACQVPGATVYGKPVGAWGDVGVLSFGGSELLTAGRGGAVLTDRGDVLQRIKVYCERGNNAYPLSELQAAVVIPQLARLAERNRIRHDHASRLRQLCQELDGLLPLVSDAGAGRSSFYKLAWLYRPECLGGCPRKQLLAAMRAEGVGLDEGFRGFALRSTRRCRKVGDLPHSQEAAEATVLLHHPVLLGTPDQIDRVALAIRKVLAHFGAR